MAAVRLGTELVEVEAAFGGVEPEFEVVWPLVESAAVVALRGTAVVRDPAGAVMGPAKVEAIAEMVGDIEGERAIRVRDAEVLKVLALGE